jgi:hypothetical protein
MERLFLGRREAIEQLLGRDELTSTRCPTLIVHGPGLNNMPKTPKCEFPELLDGLLRGNGWVRGAFRGILVIKHVRGGL